MKCVCSNCGIYPCSKCLEAEQAMVFTEKLKQEMLMEEAIASAGLAGADVEDVNQCETCKWRSDEIGYSSRCPKYNNPPQEN